MTLLYTPAWGTSAGYNVERQYMKWLTLEWLPGCLVASGNPYIIRENVFGGFEVHLKFEPSFFDWDGGGWRHDEILLDYYATAPGSSVPISAGAVGRGISFQPFLSGSTINIGQGGGTGRMWLFRLPPPPESNWYQQPPDDLPDRFCLQLPDTATILEMPVC